MVHILVSLLNFHKLDLNLPSYKPNINEEGSIIFIICNYDYLYIIFLPDNNNSLMSIVYQKPSYKKQQPK